MAAPTPAGSANIAGLFLDRSSENRDRPALRRRVGGRFASISYGEMREQVLDLAAGLRRLGLRRGDRVGLVSENWDRWLVADLAVLACGGVDVPRSLKQGVDEVTATLAHSGCRFILCAGPDEVRAVASMGDRLPALEVLIDLSDGRSAIPEAASFASVVAAGRKLRETEAVNLPDPALSPDDLATIVYTSGTTGRPKGVMLTHRNILSNVKGIHEVLRIERDEVVLSLLPTWHMYERTVEYAALAKGAEIVYTSVRRLKEDLQSVRPTFIPSVPRIWSTLYQEVCTRVAESRGWRRRMARLAWASSQRAVRARHVLAGGSVLEGAPTSKWRAAVDWMVHAPVWHALGRGVVFRPVRRATGGRLRAAISGGAGLPEVVDLFFGMAGVPVLNGYGLTETSPVLTLRSMDRNLLGTAGRPLADTEIRIVGKDGRPLPTGEIGRVVARGPQVMAGYYRDPEATRAVLDAGGWFDTGDLGRLLHSGELVITGRVKDTIVLASGENVEPEPLEERIRASVYVDQVMLVGQDQEYLAALVVPHAEALTAWARRRGLGDRPLPELVATREANDLFRSEIRAALGARRALAAVRRFRLLDEPFSVQAGTLTPTLKLKRDAVRRKHVQEIAALFHRDAAA